MTINYFLKIEGIDGESTDADHADWIEVHGYNWGVESPSAVSGGSGGHRAGRVNFQDLGVLKHFDNASPDLMIHCASGKHIPTIELDCTLITGDRHTFAKYLLNDCIVSSVTNGSNDEARDRPSETVTFSYRKIRVEYTPMDQAGTPGSTIDRTWDLETNQEV